MSSGIFLSFFSQKRLTRVKVGLDISVVGERLEAIDGSAEVFAFKSVSLGLAYGDLLSTISLVWEEVTKINLLRGAWILGEKEEAALLPLWFSWLSFHGLFGVSQLRLG